MMSYEVFVHDLGGDHYLVGAGISVIDDSSSDAKELGLRLREALQESGIRLMGPVSYQQAPTQSTFSSFKIDSAGATKLEVRINSTDLGAVLLFSDEDNVLHWIFPNDFLVGEVSTKARDKGHLIFEIPKPKNEVEMADAESDRRLLAVLVFPNRLVRTAPLAFFRGVENGLRPYQLVEFPFDDPPKSFPRSTFVPGHWLLFIHGTFSSCNGGFGAFSKEASAKFKKRYKGIIGFNHPTLGDSPSENVERLVQQLSEAKARNPWSGYSFDAVTHSRGGLVCRELCRNSDIKMKKVVMVASPNLGTQLANPNHVRNLLDTYLNLDGFLQSPRSLATMIRMIELLHHIAVETLPGLNAMQPDSKYLQELNEEEAKGTTFYGISSDFVPDETMRKFVSLEAQLRQFVFEQENDLVVPHRGAFLRKTGGMSWIPAKNRLELKGNVCHTTYFEDQAVSDKIVEWLSK